MFRTAGHLAEAHLRDLESGAAVPADFIKLGESLAVWLNQHSATIWTITHTSYCYLVRLRVVPYLGRVRLAKLQPMDLVWIESCW